MMIWSYDNWALHILWIASDAGLYPWLFSTCVPSIQRHEIVVGGVFRVVLIAEARDRNYGNSKKNDHRYKWSKETKNYNNKLTKLRFRKKLRLVTEKNFKSLLLRNPGQKLSFYLWRSWNQEKVPWVFSKYILRWKVEFSKLLIHFLTFSIV